MMGELAGSAPDLKDRHGPLIAGGLAHARTTQGLVDELWFWVSPYLWASRPRIFDGIGPLRLELIGSTTFTSGCGWPTDPPPDHEDGQPGRCPGQAAPASPASTRSRCRCLQQQAAAWARGTGHAQVDVAPAARDWIFLHLSSVRRGDGSG
jgi:hypothetical protein